MTVYFLITVRMNMSGDMLEFMKTIDLKLQKIASEIWNARMGNVEKE